MKIIIRKDNLAPIVLSALALSLIAVVLLFPVILKRGTPGSFEYIRKGEALFDKGNYAEAIRYYEKAHDSSPDSDEIKNDLVYAYSRYASKVAGDEKYDLGIEYLTKAYELISNAYTKQNLALMHAKRAVVETKRSDWVKAQDDLDIARDTVADSVTGGKNLGITLYNEAVGEFKSGRDDVAVLLAKEAVMSYADSRIYELLADIHYKRTELDKARFYLEKAAVLDPGNAKLAERVEKVIKEEALSADEKTRVLPNFDLKYDKDLPVNAGLIAGILEKAYFDIGKDLSYFPKARTVVFFYSEKDFRDIFKVRDIVRAFYDGNIRIPLPASVSDEKELASYLYHEYTHAIISAKTNNNCPVWLSEGMAVYEEMKWTRPGATVSIDGSLLEGPEVSIAALDAAFNDPGVDSIKLTLSYVLADTAVQFMVDNWGMKGIDAVLRSIADGKHAVNAMDDEYLLSEKEFNKRWAQYVMSRYVKKTEGE